MSVGGVWVDAGAGAAIVGAALGFAAFVRGSLTSRRQAERREDTLWGYVDANNVRHEGIVALAQQHISDTTVHVNQRPWPDS